MITVFDIFCLIMISFGEDVLVMLLLIETFIDVAVLFLGFSIKNI
jgi:hypothetical protein